MISMSASAISAIVSPWRKRRPWPLAATLDARTMAVLSTIPADQRGLPPALRTAATALANVITVACK